MPAPVLFVTIVLIGWPLLQLASVLAVRGRRRRLRDGVRALKTDTNLVGDLRHRGDRILADARGTPAAIVAPLTLPLAIVGAALSELVGRSRPSKINQTEAERIEARLAGSPWEGGRSGSVDARVDALENLAFEIACLRWPTTALLTVVLCLPALPLYLLAYGVRETVSVIPRGAALLLHSLMHTGLGLAGRPR